MLTLSNFVLLFVAGPLTGSDFSVTPNNGAKVRISFKVGCYLPEINQRKLSALYASFHSLYSRFIIQGIVGSYGEDAALKAYPKCETVPCHEFEDAFKVSMVAKCSGP